ncbi:hypothetical protein [Kineothrix sedimenti]|uniref:Uncharacterized protein n=1 Tax=Kineothrix sedimenti TaxID=3123317 RepID=A0ABZ3EQ58_9FIRM
MCVLRYNNFCAACAGSRKEDDRIVCVDERGVYFGLPVECVLLAPCFKLKIRRMVEVQKKQ